MAWPCISRVCCLARFWSQLDKSDLSVPLTIQNYSDIADHQEVRSVTKRVPTDRVTRNFSSPDPHHRGGSPKAPTGGDAPGLSSRGSFRGARKEPSYKPREDYHPPGVPFQSVTQYKQDFKPWPIPKRDNFPWISNGGRAGGGGGVSDNASQQQQQGERVDRGERSRGEEQQQQQQHTGTSCYRQEYRPWTGVRPAKSTRKSPSAPYTSPVSEAPRLSPETSYQAAYSVEAHKSIALHQADHVSATTATQPIPAPLHAGGIPSPSNRQQSSVSERPDLSITTKPQEQLVKTKLSPNPSAVFQSRSRVFNI